MNHDRVDSMPRASGMKDTARIRELLREIWDARQREMETAREPKLGRLWWELEQVVSQELEHMTAEEMALQD